VDGRLRLSLCRLPAESQTDRPSRAGEELIFVFAQPWSYRLSGVIYGQKLSESDSAERLSEAVGGFFLPDVGPDAVKAFPPDSIFPTTPGKISKKILQGLDSSV